MAFGPGPAGWRAAVFDMHGVLRADPVDWATEIVSGMPILLRHGGVYFDENEPNEPVVAPSDTLTGVAPRAHDGPPP